MKDNNATDGISKESSSSTQEQQQNNEQVRWFLVRFTILLPILAFIGFLLTGNIGVLIGATILSIPVYKVFAYYFPSSESESSKEK